MSPNTSNISKHERARRTAKPEFAFMGVFVGLLVGWLAGAIIEVALGRPKMLIMLATGFTGVLAGGIVDAALFWWRMRRYRATRKS